IIDGAGFAALQIKNQIIEIRVLANWLDPGNEVLQFLRPPVIVSVLLGLAWPANYLFAAVKQVRILPIDLKLFCRYSLSFFLASSLDLDETPETVGIRHLHLVALRLCRGFLLL